MCRSLDRLSSSVSLFRYFRLERTQFRGAQENYRVKRFAVVTATFESGTSILQWYMVALEIKKFG